MADIEIRRRHGTTPDAARATAERIAAELGERFGLRGEWQGDTFNFKRSGLNGFLRVSGEDLHLSVSLGLLLKAMREPIERAVVNRLDAVFPTRR